MLGEWIRAGLAVLRPRGTTCLGPDEPANHLGLDTVERPARAPEDCRGTLLLVTRDRKPAQAVGVDRTPDVTTLAR
ncbi:hypothetical protein Q5530_25000 [Saccharothrix sp. BKS2]|uniref:hypothetical protein n=1 Tax=Saccharothrix sp. BKS2 TaxID=3064400 RepID=UPI0039ED4C18